MIEIKDIRKTYRMGETTVRALDGVSLRIDQGDFVAIMGPSGSGKSTLMHLLGLLDSPEGGSYNLLGRDVSHLSEDEMARLRSETLGFVFQQFNLLSRTQALENVLLPSVYGAKPTSPDDAKLILGRVGLGDRLHHKPSELSGGQQQRVAIARALINSPKILFADEPTGNLDSESTDEIMRLLTELNRSGITIILVTHEQEIADYAKRTIRMRYGKIQSDERKDGNPPFHPERADLLPPTFSKERGIGPAKLRMYVKQGVTALMANKVRSGLSMLGILIGVAAVIAMLAIGTGAKRSIEEQLSSLGSNLLVLSPGGRFSFGISSEAGSSTRFTTDDAKEIQKHISQVKRTGPTATGKARVVFGNKNWSSSVNGVLPIYAEMRNHPVVAGRYFTEDEDESRARVALLGTTVVREVFGDRNPIGETIKINRTGFLVIGVLKEKGTAGPRDQDDIVLVPLSTAMRRLLGKNFVDSIDIEVRDPKDMAIVEAEVKALVTLRHRLPPSQTESFNVRNMAEMQEALTSTSRVMSMLLSCIAAISLLVGGIGIMNIMLVSVSERTREIGLRKAIGARRIDILSQFLVEAVIVSLSGGGLGLLLGVSITLAISKLAGWATYISFSSVILAFAFSAAIGIVFGLWPAKKASELNPIVALRFE